MCKLDARAHLEQRGIHRRARRGRVQPEELGGAVQEKGVAERLCGGREDEQSRLGRERQEALGIALLDLAHDRPAHGQAEPAGELFGVPGSRQLEERERIAVALGNDLLADSCVERAVDVGQQQRARVALAEPLDGHRREP